VIDSVAFGATITQLHHTREHAMAFQAARASWAARLRWTSTITVGGNEIPAHTVKLLISGVPGAGKTTVASYLADRIRGRHLDLEASRYRKPLISGSPSVISWGFAPHTDLALVAELRADGYQMIWLDGDRAASYRAYMAREKHDPDAEYLYYSQMAMITGAAIVSRLRPLTINPFTGGQFRPVAEIAEQILFLTYGWRP
jgi:hypothetical protein